MQKTARIVFLGTSSFAIPILKALLENDYNVVAVVTKKDRPGGRGLQVRRNPVAHFTAEETAQNSIKVIQPENLAGSSAQKEIKDLMPGLIIVAAYGMMVPQEILAIPPHGCLNVHPSLLPQYRGASPIQAAIAKRDKTTGVSIIKMSQRMDAGDIVAQTRIAIPEKVSYSELEEQLSQVSASLLIKVIPDYLDRKIIPRKQKEEEATFTSLIKKEDGHIKWSMPAADIEAIVRAFNPQPGTYFFWSPKKGKSLRIAVIKATALTTESGSSPGTVFISKDISSFPCVATGRGTLVIEEIKPEGKKVMSALDFINGHHDFIGTILS